MNVASTCEPMGAIPAPASSSPANDRPADAWARHADALASWTDRHLVNRRDVFGHYIAVEKRRPGQTARTAKSGLTLAVLERHYRGRSTGDLIGLHTTVRDEDGTCWSRWLVVDIDRHDDSVAHATTWKAARAWYDRALGLGFRPLLLDSNGDGGYHLGMIFDGPVITEQVYEFGRWLIRDWADFGLTEAPETFPKQASITPDRYGNFLRLPGRHHTRDHYTRVWDGRTWLDGEAAIEALLKTTGSSATLIPPEAWEPRRAVELPRANRDAELARVALEHLGPLADDYDDWIKVGMCLRTLGDAGLVLWDEWSKQSSKYEEGFCEQKWETFSANGGLTLGTLFYLAKREGWEGPREFYTPPAQVFANSARDGDEDKAALRMGQLAERLDAITLGWPKRLDERLFVADADGDPVYLDSAARLFAFIDAHAQVAWAKGPRFITQERFYEHLRMTAPRYDSIETLPHWPPMPRTYYMHRPLPEPSGKLATLLDFFCPATSLDRDLIKALILSPFWGGQPGNRPAFLITGPEQDREQGRGVGKTTLVDIISQGLADGSIDVSPTDEIARVKTRLLSGNRCRVRFARLDNVKTLKFSWADLEGLITAPEISGHALFQGEGRRPNVLTWAITLNGASLSKDLAQRVIPVRLGRPRYDATWEGRVREFIQRYRWELIAEIGRTLEAEAPPITPRSRWAAWEQGVLSRVGDPAACQAEILARQGAIDDDGEDRDQVTEYFAAQLRDHGHDPETGVILIPAHVATDWLSGVTRKQYATNAASAYINSLSIDRLTRSRTTHARGWIWRGAAASQTSKPVPLEPDRGAAPTPGGLRLKA